MSRSKTAKHIVLEVVQWGAFASPVLVTGVRLAKVDSEYWLLVALIIGYVAVSTLLVWIPVKLAFQWMKLASFRKGRWSPGMLLFFLLCCIPCTVMILVCIAGDPAQDYQSDCVELMIIMLVLTDITERLKKLKLRSETDSGASGMLSEIPESMQERQNSVMEYSFRRRSSQASLVTSSRHSSKSSYFVWVDPRPWVLMRVLLNAYDVRLLLSLADPKLVPFALTYSVIDTNWTYAIYIISLAGISTFVLTGKCSYSIFVTVLLLDLPFFLLRFAYVCHFHHVISLLFFFKNLLVVASFFYFNVVRRWAYGAEVQMFGPVQINTVERSMYNGEVPTYSSFPSQRNRAKSQTNNNNITNPNYGNHADQFNYSAYVLDERENVTANDYRNEHGNTTTKDERRESYSHRDANSKQDHDEDDHEFDSYHGDEYQQQYERSYDDVREEQTQQYYQMPAARLHRETVLRPDLFEAPAEDARQQQHQHYPSQHDSRASHRETAAEESAAANSTTPTHAEHVASSTTPAHAEHDRYDATEPEERRKSRKKKAPEVPAQQMSPPGQDEYSPEGASNLIPPPPDFTAPSQTGMVEMKLGPQRISVRRDLRYTPDIAAQIAREAVAIGVINELDQIVNDEEANSTSSVEVRL